MLSPSSPLQLGSSSSSPGTLNVHLLSVCLGVLALQPLIQPPFSQSPPPQCCVLTQTWWRVSPIPLTFSSFRLFPSLPVLFTLGSAPQTNSALSGDVSDCYIWGADTPSFSGQDRYLPISWQSVFYSEIVLPGWQTCLR